MCNQFGQFSDIFLTAVTFTDISRFLGQVSCTVTFILIKDGREMVSIYYTLYIFLFRFSAFVEIARIL